MTTLAAGCPRKSDLLEDRVGETALPDDTGKPFPVWRVRRPEAPRDQKAAGLLLAMPDRSIAQEAAEGAPDGALEGIDRCSSNVNIIRTNELWTTAERAKAKSARQFRLR
ncbi:hypothetical protein A33O_00095 [Nitratireductor aquibiodomus RA22]|uniref:Uncharacterized protein n=1 Tax=Nitratireductor aquibiodomus RA22 TaxID=1189611 RepID=I5C8J5_9HYPH|nr:hypothetical protein A33O_00095 [Nitratireductor aquibiodomus RA22]